MAEDVLEAIEGLLEEVQEEVVDPDASYKLRTARQLLTVLEHRDEGLRAAVKGVGSDDELRERLQDLGYL